MCNLAKCSFIVSPGSTAHALHEQYTRDLSRLLGKHAAMVSQTFTKGAAGWLSDPYLQAIAGGNLNRSGSKTNPHKIRLDSTNRLSGVLP